MPDELQLPSIPNPAPATMPAQEAVQFSDLFLESLQVQMVGDDTTNVVAQSRLRPYSKATGRIAPNSSPAEKAAYPVVNDVIPDVWSEAARSGLVKTALGAIVASEALRVAEASIIKQIAALADNADETALRTQLLAVWTQMQVTPEPTTLYVTMPGQNTPQVFRVVGVKRRHLCYRRGAMFLWFATDAFDAKGDGPEWWLTPMQMVCNEKAPCWFLSAESPVGSYVGWGAAKTQANLTVTDTKPT